MSHLEGFGVPILLGRTKLLGTRKSVGQFAGGAIRIAVGVDQVEVLLVLLDEVHAAFFATVLNVEVNGLKVTNKSFFPHETDGAHVALVDVATEVLFAVVALEDVPLVEEFVAVRAAERGQEGSHCHLKRSPAKGFPDLAAV
jgi:hypothetical protein